MSRIALVISDLHLSDERGVLNSFGDNQQAALEGLLAAACSGGPLGSAEEVELIIAITEYEMLRESLTLPQIAAVAAICTPATYIMGEDVAQGMHTVLASDASLRYAIAGHTHMARIDPVSNGRQTYLNTGSWTSRLSLPAPGEVNDELLRWLKSPDDEHIPLRDVTQLVFAMVNSMPEGSSSASLCAWEGGSMGSYRVLA